MAYCPNCADEISADVARCPTCAADFAADGAWKPLLTADSKIDPGRIAEFRAARARDLEAVALSPGAQGAPTVDTRARKRGAAAFLLAGGACVLASCAIGTIPAREMQFLVAKHWYVVLGARTLFDYLETAAKITAVAWPLLALMSCIRPAGVAETRAALVARGVVSLAIWAVPTVGWFFVSNLYGGRRQDPSFESVVPGVLLYLGYVLIGCAFAWWVLKKDEERASSALETQRLA
jgi:hypothetical protein